MAAAGSEPELLRALSEQLRPVRIKHAGGCKRQLHRSVAVHPLRHVYNILLLSGGSNFQGYHSLPSLDVILAELRLLPRQVPQQLQHHVSSIRQHV